MTFWRLKVGLLYVSQQADVGWDCRVATLSLLQTAAQLPRWCPDKEAAWGEKIYLYVWLSVLDWDTGLSSQTRRTPPPACSAQPVTCQPAAGGWVSYIWTLCCSHHSDTTNPTNTDGKFLKFLPNTRVRLLLLLLPLLSKTLVFCLIWGTCQ